MVQETERDDNQPTINGPTYMTDGLHMVRFSTHDCEDEGVAALLEAAAAWLRSTPYTFYNLSFMDHRLAVLDLYVYGEGGDES